MTTIVLEEPGRFATREGPEPRPAGGEALVRVHRIGVCGTDIHAYAGRQPFFEYPRVLGHELGVEVLEVPGENAAGLRPGDRCAVEPYLNDPSSPASRAGRSNCCERLAVLGVHTDGGMRPLLSLPAEKLHRSDSLSFDALAIVETLCIGAHGVGRAAVTAADQVLVVGAGPIGLGAIQSALTTGAEVAAADVSDHRLAFCRRVTGLGRTLPADALEEAGDGPLRDLFGGRLPSVVIDATGNRDSMAAATSRTAHGGRIVFLGIVQGTVALDDPELHRRELTVLGSRNATPATFRKVLDALEAGRIDTAPWITARLSLADVPGKFGEVTSAEGSVKTLIEVGR